MRSLKIGTFFNIGVYVHWSFALLPLFVILTNLDAGASMIGFSLGLLVALFVCVVLHEFGHALMARYFGIGTRDITLYPIGGVARLERMSEQPAEEILIAVAGPAVNIVIAVVLAVVAIVGVVLLPFDWIRDSIVSQFVLYLMLLNVTLVVFNMLPAFPMDGGRVFRALLSMWMPRLTATRIATGLGMLLALVLGIGGFVLTVSAGSPNPLLLIVAVFVLLAGQAELRYLEWKEQWERQAPIEVLPVYRDCVQIVPIQEESQEEERLVLKPRISVWTWDSRAGAWVKE